MSLSALRITAVRHAALLRPATGPLRPVAVVRHLNTQATHAAPQGAAKRSWKVIASVSVAGLAGVAGITTIALCDANTTAPANTDAASSDEGDILRDTEVRYAGYSARIGNVLAMASRTLAGKVRYLGYTSDIGESARPIMDVKYVNLFYAITFAYVIGDIFYQGHRAREAGYDNMEVGRTMAQTLAFQGIVSVIMPSLIIHQGVHLSKKVFESAPGRMKVFGPVIVGLCIIPFLPFLDHPAEDLINTAFCKVWPSKYPERNHGHEAAEEHGEKKEH